MTDKRLSFISYLRVSTDKQGRSGLGLEAQREAVRLYVASLGGIIVAEFIEIETGKLATRPELAKAIARCKRSKDILLVAKLDRLARNVAFTSAIMDSGVEFVCADNPHANRLTLHILAAVAEDEARRISERTTAALAAAKRRGVLLGSARPGHWEGRENQRLKALGVGRKRSIESRGIAAMTAYSDLLPFIEELRQSGLPFRDIAERLTSAGHTTRNGKPWGPSQVKRLLDRARPSQAVS